MSWLLTGVALVVVGYGLGFIVGVWATHDWVERIAPGTSRQLLELDARQKRNLK